MMLRWSPDAHASAPKDPPGSHNGLQSVEDVLETRDYSRLRIGVGGRAAGESILPTGFCRSLTIRAMRTRCSMCFLDWRKELRFGRVKGIEAAMNRYNVPSDGNETNETKEGR